MSHKTVDALLGSRAAAPFFRPLLGSRTSVFMLHRFALPDLGIEGHDPVRLRRVLEALRHDRVHLLSLDELFAGLAAGRRWSRPAVAFTIDDGYVDQALVGAPAFAAYDCPVTTFVSTGFLDRQLWFWWDQIEYAFEHAPRESVVVELGSERLEYAWADDVGRRRAQRDFTQRCKLVSDASKLDAIARLTTALEIPLPPDAPDGYAPMTWDELRDCEWRGMTFGPHTVSHPVLSRTTDVQARWELETSWTRLRNEARRAVALFCYPNGQYADFGSREIAILRGLGMRGAVVGVSGYADRAHFRTDADGPYRVRRFAYPDSVGAVRQLVNGVERFKQLVLRQE